MRDLLDDRTTVMSTKDGGRKEIDDRIVTDPVESRRKTAEDWTGQTVFYKRKRENADQITEAYAMVVDEVATTEQVKMKQSHRRLRATLCTPQVLEWWTLDVAGV